MPLWNITNLRNRQSQRLKKTQPHTHKGLYTTITPLPYSTPVVVFAVRTFMWNCFVVLHMLCSAYWYFAFESFTWHKKRQIYTLHPLFCSDWYVRIFKWYSHFSFKEMLTERNLMQTQSVGNTSIHTKYFKLE